ncbi:MAG TPA: ABC transporter ATP-binding protein [Longimicrobiales bacterium]
MSLYRRILRYLAPYSGVLVAAALAMVAFAALDAFSLLMLIPFLKLLFGEAPLEVGGDEPKIQWVLDHTLGWVVPADAPPADLLIGINLFILGVFLLKNVCDFLRQYLVVRLEQAVTRDLRVQVYDHLLDLDLRFFGSTKVGQIITRLTSDVDQLRSLVTKNASQFATSVFQIIASVAVLITISFELTVISLVIVPGMFGIWARIRKRLRRGDRRVLDLGGEVSSHLQETVSGIRVVKAAAAEGFERDRFRRLTWIYFKSFVRTERLRALVSPMNEMMGAIGTVLLLWYGSRMVLVEQTLDATTFITFLGIALRLYQPLKWVSKFPSVVQPGLVGAERVFEFLDAPIEIHDRKGARRFTGVSESIRFEAVSFAYTPDRPVLRGITLEAAAGDVVALVGPSGAGKTTLVDLVARFYDPTAGRILVDGIDLRDYNIASFRSRLGIVTQETVLFHDTVRANIAYGLDSVSDEAVERAARAAHAHEFIIGLPEGYDTLLGERGTRLSGGQRQRIAIARAMLRDPAILIFDEATSALDTESERLVQRAMEELLVGRTVFVIAHRLSTIRRADRILVLHDGRIAEQGTHDELMERRGIYRRLYDLQFGQELTTDAADAERVAASTGDR